MQNNKDVYGFIYITINLINDKKYIGKHTNLYDEYYGSGKLIVQDIKKYGKSNFKRIILDFAYTEYELNELEKFYISIYNAVKDPQFYNIHIGGNGGFTRAGYTVEEEQQYRQKMKKIAIQNNYLRIGKLRTKQEKINISNGCKRRWMNISSEDKQIFKNIMRAAVLGEKNPNFNHKWSTIKKKQLSNKLKAQGHSKGINNPNFGCSGDKAKNGKALYMYDINLNFIKRFNTKTQVLDFLNLKNHNTLNKVINKNILYHQYYWYTSLLNV